MVELIDKPILAEKKITQESLEQYKIPELLLGMSCEFYENLTKDFGNSESPAYGQVYTRGYLINLSLANIAHYLSCPHYNDIQGTGLEEEVDFDEVTKGTRPLGDAKVYRFWCGATVSYSIHTRTQYTKVASLSPPPSTDSSTVTTNLDLLNQQLSSLLGIEVVLLFKGVEDLKGFKVKQLVPRASLEELK
ncbi:hypothetical protein M9H77_08313 [Catharanthus roseus]|uniref:Uncharacterized protein n=1 Tax=Catharanthus roseus TaxID=4058 RepID=A0ACC0BXE3_CATRO|nr:hypothetical protein M9H77_08313 [Catharanthus roseus]